MEDRHEVQGKFFTLQNKNLKVTMFATIIELTFENPSDQCNAELKRNAYYP